MAEFHQIDHDGHLCLMDEQGTIHALAPGEAYVIYVAATSMFSLYKITVTG